MEIRYKISHFALAEGKKPSPWTAEMEATFNAAIVALGAIVKERGGKRITFTVDTNEEL